MVALLFVWGGTEVSAREFTDEKGRKIEAELVSYTAENIELKRGTKVFSLPVAKFSKADQEFIKEWKRLNPTKTGYRFRFFVEVEEDRNTRKTTDGAMIQDKLKTRPHNYNVVVYNQSGADLTDVTIRYEIYVNDVVDTKGNRYASLAVGQKKKDKVQTIPGKMTGKKIPGNGKIEFIHHFELHNYVDRDGGKVDQAASDNVIGIRVRVYRGDEILSEHTAADDNKRIEDARWTGTEAKEETPEQ